MDRDITIPKIIIFGIVMKGRSRDGPFTGLMREFAPNMIVRFYFIENKTAATYLFGMLLFYSQRKIDTSTPAPQNTEVMWRLS